jgi:hypothetical protein
MLTWILIALGVYVLIGVILFLWAIFTDPWGGLILAYAPLIIFGYPYLWIRAIIDGIRYNRRN